jgi:hypothetical protein
MIGGTTMNPNEAAKLLTAAILNTGTLAELTTAPTSEQQEALQSVIPGDAAPEAVCGEMGLDAGCIWGAVLGEMAAEVASSSVIGEDIRGDHA